MTPLDDDEVRDLTLWETNAEVDAFREGWIYRRVYGGATRPPDAKSLAFYPENQNARVAWERGWIACDAAHNALLEEERADVV